MTWTERTAIMSHIAVTILCGVVTACALSLTHSLNGAVAGVNRTLLNVNRPCKGPAGADACGTLAQINKVAIAAGDVANASAMQVKQSGSLIAATTRNIDMIGVGVTTTTQSLSRTADSASESLQVLTGHITPALDATTATVTSLDAAIKGLSPVEIAANQAVLDFDAALKNPDVPRILANVQSITATSSHMMVTTDAVETKLTQCTLHPTFVCSLKSNFIFGAQVGGYLLH